jgi:hypothetical protein
MSEAEKWLDEIRALAEADPQPGNLETAVNRACDLWFAKSGAMGMSVFEATLSLHTKPLAESAALVLVQRGMEVLRAAGWSEAEVLEAITSVEASYEN